jgi:hypothetical protein
MAEGCDFIPQKKWEQTPTGYYIVPADQLDIADLSALDRHLLDVSILRGGKGRCVESPRQGRNRISTGRGENGLRCSAISPVIEHFPFLSGHFEEETVGIRDLGGGTAGLEETVFDESDFDPPVLGRRQERGTGSEDEQKRNQFLFHSLKFLSGSAQSYKFLSETPLKNLQLSVSPFFSPDETFLEGDKFTSRMHHCARLAT